MIYNIHGDELRIAWIEADKPLTLKINEQFIIITGKTTQNFKQGELINFKISNNPLCEFATIWNPNN